MYRFKIKLPVGNEHESQIGDITILGYELPGGASVAITKEISNNQIYEVYDCFMEDITYLEDVIDEVLHVYQDGTVQPIGYIYDEKVSRLVIFDPQDVARPALCSGHPYRAKLIYTTYIYPEVIYAK